jgi:hypothetical protein
MKEFCGCGDQRCNADGYGEGIWHFVIDVKVEVGVENG